MRPPLQSVVRSPPNGVETSAHTPSVTRSRVPTGSRATTVPNGRRAHAARSGAGSAAAASARCAAQLPVCARKSRRESDMRTQIAGWRRCGPRHTLRRLPPIRHPASPTRPMRRTLASAILLVAAPLAAQSADPTARLDSIFRAYARTDRPGCAVGVTQQGQPLVEKGYGMADLEHDAPITPRTVFEAGSVSKQITAGAIVLLSLDGKLSLDDDVRKYLPELPEYGTTITIRHLLTHTSGLRDWGSVVALGGWPRTTRGYTNDLVLDVARHQRSLNYTPGQYYSYTNTGYNLLALVVGRVSGKPLAQFTKERIFEPLGMTQTEWRDDFTRVVKGRAVAYARGPQGVGYRMDMPFEN